MWRDDVTVAASADKTCRCTSVTASASIASTVRLQARSRETPESARTSESGRELRDFRKAPNHGPRHCDRAVIGEASRALLVHPGQHTGPDIVGKSGALVRGRAG